MSNLPSELANEIITACRVLTHFRMVEGFGHVSARIPNTDHWVITPRKALALVQPEELVVLDYDGKQVGEGRPPLEAAMHLAVFRRRPDVAAIARAHPRYIAAYASAAESIKVAHGFGCNLGAEVPVHREPYLVTDDESGDAIARVLGNNVAVMLQANGMLATGESVPDACVKALFMEETAQIQLTARAAGLTPQAYSPETAERRCGMDRPNEPVRAWAYYVAMTQGWR